MADVVLTVLLFLAAAAALLLAHRAVRHWRSERTGRAYELPVDRTGTALRAGAAGAAALLAAGLAVPLVSGGHPAVGTPAAAPAPVPVVVPPPPPARTPEPAPPAPEVRTLGHPAGGTLQLLQDGTRVWLPPLYASRRAARVSFPVVVVHLPAADDPDLYAGFAAEVRRRRADPFVLVLPRDCSQDSAAALAQAARRYRVLATRDATGVIGLGAAAPCAVREALANPTRYRAAAGISGVYPPLTPSRRPRPFLMLAASTSQAAAHASALRLRGTLHPRGDEVRVIDGIPAHRGLFALVADYLTEKLDGPARTAARTAAKAAVTPTSVPTRAPSRIPPTVPARTPAVSVPAAAASSSAAPSVRPSAPPFVSVPPHGSPPRSHRSPLPPHASPRLPPPAPPARRPATGAHPAPAPLASAPSRSALPHGSYPAQSGPQSRKTA